MTKLILAAVLALSIVETAVFGGPYDTSSMVAYNGHFQLQGH